jgi:hypothetical protein
VRSKPDRMLFLILVALVQKVDPTPRQILLERPLQSFLPASILARLEGRALQPLLLKSKCCTVNRMMRFNTAFPLIAKVCLKLIAIFAKIMQNPRPISSVFQRGTAFISQRGCKFTHSAYMFSQRMPFPYLISAMCKILGRHFSLPNHVYLRY